MQKQAIYHFPVENAFHAREVTEADFDIHEHEGGEALYVDLDAARITDLEFDYLQNLKFTLNIDPDHNALLVPTTDYKKVVFLGHRGTGKTLELRRLHRELNDPARYFSILIEIERELEVSTVQSQDFFIMLIFKLIRELNQRGMGQYTDRFDHILEDWLRNEEVVREVQEKAGLEGSVGAGLNDKNLIAQLITFLKFQLDVKGTLAYENKVTKTIREKVRKDGLQLVNLFNEALIDVRAELVARYKGQDILFIIDGSEKLSFQVYEDLFQKDVQIIQGIHANMVLAARIDAFYRIQDKPNLDFFERVFVPMIRLDGPTKMEAMRQVVAKRMRAELFFEAEALDFLIVASGGCLRQFIRLVNQCILYARGKVTHLPLAQKVAYEVEGRHIWETLDSEHLRILEEVKLGKKIVHWADSKVSELMFSLVLLKYNGHVELNPLIRPYIGQYE